VILSQPTIRTASLFGDDEPVLQSHPLLSGVRDGTAVMPRFGDTDVWDFNGVVRRPPNLARSQWKVPFSGALADPAWNLLAREIDAPPQAAPTRLTQSETDDIHPTWSHDGRLLAFSRYNPMDARWELWVMDFPRRTLTCVGPGLFPSFCPVARRQMAEGQPVYTLAYQDHRQRDIPFYSLWTMDVAFRYGKIEAVGAPAEVVASSEWAAITPSWSPSGEYLAFATVRQSPLARAQGRLYRADQVWVVRADGADLTPVTSHAAPNWYPCWAPEDNNPMGRLYFTSSRSGYPNVWSVRPNVPGLMRRYARQGLIPSPR